MKYEITDQRLINKAKLKYGKGWMEELQKLVIKSARQVLGLDADVAPKDAAGLMGVSLMTIRRYIAKGEFPGAYWVNARKVLIPLRDIEAIRNRTAGV